MDHYVHPTAEVAPDAQVGPGTKIWHQAQVMPDAKIGAECILGKGVYVDFGVQIGARSKLQNYALIYRGSILEDDVFVGPAAVLANDRSPRAATPNGGLKTDTDWHIEGVIVRTGASIGANVVVAPGVAIGRYAMVGAGAVVTRDVADHSLVVGNPARPIGEVCICGDRLDDGLRCGGCGRGYRRDDTTLALLTEISP